MTAQPTMAKSMTAAPLNSLDQALQLIEQVEQTAPQATAYEIANRLRGHTKKDYTTRFWAWTTGFKQDFVDANLNGTIALANEPTDFAHMIAALSDQVNQPGINLSDLTQWTADYTSWAGDIGSAIVTYTRQPQQFSSVMEAFDRYAGDLDHAANIAAYLIGYALNRDPQLKVSQAIRNYHAEDFDRHVIAFVTLRFGDTDPAPQVRQAIVRYLSLAADQGLWGQLQGWLGRGKKGQAYTETEISYGIAHFLNFLQRKSRVVV